MINIFEILKYSNYHNNFNGLNKLYLNEITNRNNFLDLYKSYWISFNDLYEKFIYVGYENAEYFGKDYISYFFCPIYLKSKNNIFSISKCLKYNIYKHENNLLYELNKHSFILLYPSKGIIFKKNENPFLLKNIKKCF